MALVALSVAAGPAFSLSCVRPDPAAAFNYAAEAEDSFVILRGKFAFDGALLPDPAGQPYEKTIEAIFEGTLLTGNGFTDEVAAPVSLVLTCAGPWCGRISPNTEYMAFVLQTEERLLLDVGPCYQFTFANPSDDMVAKVEQCAAGGDCQPGK